MLIVLPGPVACRVKEHDGRGTVWLKIRDAAHGEDLAALLEKAVTGGFAVELRLLHYEGQKDAIRQSAERRRRKQTGEKLTVREEEAGQDALLRECHGALRDACCTEDGLDCGKGVPLLKRIEALFPDLAPIFEGEPL
jgi:hypothetical protein